MFSVDAMLRTYKKRVYYENRDKIDDELIEEAIKRVEKENHVVFPSGENKADWIRKRFLKNMTYSQIAKDTKRTASVVSDFINNQILNQIQIEYGIFNNLIKR